VKGWGQTQQSPQPGDRQGVIGEGRALLPDLPGIDRAATFTNTSILELDTLTRLAEELDSEALKVIAAHR
jgi:hypothetical protein